MRDGPLAYGPSFGFGSWIRVRIDIDIDIGIGIGIGIGMQKHWIRGMWLCGVAGLVDTQCEREICTSTSSFAVWFGVHHTTPYIYIPG